MKKAYWLILIIVIAFFTKQAVVYGDLQEGRRFYAPWRNDRPGSHFTLKMPYLQNEKTDQIVPLILEQAKRLKLNLFYYSSESEYEMLDTEQQQDLYAYLGSDENASSKPDSARELSTYHGNFSNQRLEVCQADSERINQFIQALQNADCTCELMPNDNDFWAFAVSDRDYLREYFSLTYQWSNGNVFLPISALIFMFIYLFQSHRRWALYRLFSFGYWRIFLKMLHFFALPYALIALLLYCPLSVWAGVRSITAVLQNVPFFTLQLLVFFGVQILLLMLASLLMRYQSVLSMLQARGHLVPALSFAFVVKVAVLFLLLPLLFFHVERTKDGWQALKRMNDLESAYENVSTLRLKDPEINLQTYASDGTLMEKGKTSWFKAFYDQVRDQWPLVICLPAAYADNPADAADPKNIQLLVNGNYVNSMGLKDKDGRPLTLDNEDKAMLVSEEFHDSADQYRKKIEEGFISPGFDHRAFVPDNDMAVWDKDKDKKIPIHTLAAGSQITRYCLDTSSSGSKIHSTHIFLVVNSFDLPLNLRGYMFVGMSAEMQSELLKSIRNLPFSDNLEWAAARSNVQDMKASVVDTFTVAATDLAKAALTLLAIAIMFYTLCFSACERRLAVGNLFGSSYCSQSLHFFVTQLALYFLVLLFVGHPVPSVSYYGALAALFGLEFLVYLCILLRVRSRKLQSLQVT